MVSLELALVESIRIASGLCDTVANALRTRALCERRRVKACWRFGGTLLRNTGQNNGECS